MSVLTRQNPECPQSFRHRDIPVGVGTGHPLPVVGPPRRDLLIFRASGAEGPCHASRGTAPAFHQSSENARPVGPIPPPGSVPPPRLHKSAHPSQSWPSPFMCILHIFIFTRTRLRVKQEMCKMHTLREEGRACRKPVRGRAKT